MTTRALAVAGCLAGSLTVTADTVVKAEKDGDCKVATGPTGEFEARGFCVDMLDSGEVKLTDNELEKYDESDGDQTFAFTAIKDIDADPNKPDIGQFAVKKDDKIAFVFNVRVRDDTADPGDYCYSYSKDVTAKDLLEWDKPSLQADPALEWLQPSFQAFKGLKNVAYKFAWLSPSRAGNDGGAFIFKWEAEQSDLKDAEQEEKKDDGGAEKKEVIKQFDLKMAEKKVRFEDKI